MPEIPKMVHSAKFIIARKCTFSQSGSHYYDTFLKGANVYEKLRQGKELRILRVQ